MWFRIAIAFAAISLATPVSAAPAGETGKGAYLATVGDCAVCHTAPGRRDRPFAGGYPLHASFGTVYSSNITPDLTTGIGNWTPDQFYRALTHGIGIGGKHLYPAFPYPYFTNVPRADSDALFAYLRTVRAVKYKPPHNHLIFPTDIRGMMTFWNALFLPQSDFHPASSKPADWNRGGELVHGLGHCGGCHTPKTFLFSDVTGELLQGGAIDGWYAPNLTGSSRTGLGQWSVADIESYLKTGSNRFERVAGAMQDVVGVSTSRMTDGDREAIAVYLKSLPPAPEKKPSAPPAEVMQIGQAAFFQNCSVCHAADTKDYPLLGGNAIVRFDDPTTMLRVILQGSQSLATPGQPVGYSMPAFGYLTDAQIAEIATYVRNSWGNHAGAVSPTQAAELRHMVETRS